jgi:hypothetical protein
MSCQLVNGYRHFEGLLGPKDGGTTLLRNVDKNLSVDTAQHPFTLIFINTSAETLNLAL